MVRRLSTIIQYEQAAITFFRGLGLVIRYNNVKINVTYIHDIRRWCTIIQYEQAAITFFRGLGLQFIRSVRNAG